MRSLQIILFYAVRVFILLVFSFIMIATMNFSNLIQIPILTMMILYFSLLERRLEYSLFEIHYSKKNDEVKFLIASKVACIIFNLVLLTLFFMQFYSVVFIIMMCECALKVFVDINLEDILTFRKLVFKGDIYEIEI